MDVARAGRVARLLRVRARMTQRQLATRAGVSGRAVYLLETGRGRSLRLRTIESIVGSLSARIDLRMMWNGPELDRLLDAGHAALSAGVKQQLTRWGWLVRVEVSYAHFGERGRVDLLAFHPPTRTLLVIEVKTMLVDVQELVGSLDAKTRLARTIAEPIGWHPKVVVPAIVFAERPATRAQLAQLEPLFDRFTERGRRALTWMRKPGEPPTGLLWFRQLPPAARRDLGGQRVYARSPAA
jgi:transcriptional regulator with XRE-family HTH domain